MTLVVQTAISYAVGLVIVNHLLLAWMHSNFPQHLWNLIHRKSAPVFTKEDLIAAAVSRYGAWGDLWSCPLCLGTWLGALVSGAIALTADLSWWFTPTGAFSYAGILFLAHKKIGLR